MDIFETSVVLTPDVLHPSSLEEDHRAERAAPVKPQRDLHPAHQVVQSPVVGAPAVLLQRLEAVEGGVADVALQVVLGGVLVVHGERW